MDYRKSGDLGLITTQKPRNMASGVAEFFTDADNYSIEFDPNANLTAAQKATVLSSQLLFDYMLFDGSTEKITMDSEGITFNCCYCSIIGCICPCSINVPFDDSAN